MNKIVTSIRDINEIETELNEALAGVISIQLDGDNLLQIPTNFIYLDKNIYVYLDKEEEVFNNIRFGYPASFSIVNSKKAEGENITYRLKSITINGDIRLVDEQKVIDQLKELYRQKYSSDDQNKNYKIPKNYTLVIIDSSEIKAVIEEGN